MQKRKSYRAIRKSIKSNQPVNGEKSIINDTTFLAGNLGYSLKKDQKEIIDLAYFGSFTVKEISKSLLIPPEMVKRKLRL